MNAHFTDVEERHLLIVENGMLNYAKGKQSDAADVTLSLARGVLDEILLGQPPRHIASPTTLLHPQRYG